MDQNEDALQALCAFSSIQFTSDQSQDSVSELSPEKQLEAFQGVVVGNDRDEMPMDIKSKMIVILVNLKAKHLIKVQVFLFELLSYI